MYSDVSGYVPEWLKTVGTVAAAIAVVCLVTAVVTLTAGAAAYIILGAAAQTGIATVMIGAASGGLIAGSISMVGQSTLGDDSIDFGTVAIDTFTGSAFGAISGFGGAGATLGTKMAIGGAKVGLAIGSSVLHGLNDGLSPTQIFSVSNKRGTKSMLRQTALIFGSAFFGGSGTSGIISKLTSHPNTTSSLIVAGSMLYDFVYYRNEE